VHQNPPRSGHRTSKVIAFAVKLDEYERLKAEYAASAAHSISELVRFKVLRAVSGQSLAGIAKHLDELEHAFKELNAALRHGGARQRGDQAAGASHGR